MDGELLIEVVRAGFSPEVHLRRNQASEAMETARAEAQNKVGILEPQQQQILWWLEPGPKGERVVGKKVKKQAEARS